MKLFTILLDKSTINLIKKHYRFKEDDEVEKRLRYWIDLSISEVILKDCIKVLENKEKPKHYEARVYCYNCQKGATLRIPIGVKIDRICCPHCSCKTLEPNWEIEEVTCQKQQSPEA